MKRYIMNSNRTKWMARMFVLAALTGVAPWANSTGIFTNIDFDADVAGLPPAGAWNIFTQSSVGSTVAVTSAQSTSAPNSLELRTGASFDSTPIGASGVILQGLSTYMPAASNDLVRFHLRMTSATDQQFRFGLMDPGNAGLFQVVFYNGNINAQYEVANVFQQTTIGTYAADQWYSVNIETLPNTYTYGVSVFSNGAFVGSAANLGYFDNILPTGIYFVNDGLTTPSTTGIQSVFIDQTFVGTQVPEPSVVALMGIGAALAAVVRRSRSR